MNDTEGNEAPAGQPGELVVQGESFARFYWNKPERTASAWTKDGWFRSGDTMYRDQDGYFFFCGRGDDMLKVGGMWVAPFEIESALAAHPAVIEAAVIGAPDENELIKPKAFCVLRDPDDAAPQLVAPADRLDLPARLELAGAVPVSRREILHLLEGRTATDLDQSVLSTLASLDGAIVVDRDGRLLAAGAILRHPQSDELLQGGFIEGARTTAATAASRFGPVLKVSEDGEITFYDRERIWDI